MDDPYIFNLDYAVLSKIQNILENPTTMQSFLGVLPPDCSNEDVLISLQLSSQQYNNTPAKELLRILGNKGKRVSHLIRWFQESGLERALMYLKEEVNLKIIEQPQQEVRVPEGSELLLKCTAVSNPPPEYQWFKDDVELLLEVEPILSIKCARLKDSGVYACLVTRPVKDTDACEWCYSNLSDVKVIQSDLHVMPPCEGPITSSSSFVHSEKTSDSLNKEKLVINKHPFIDGKIAQGMSVCLTCEADSSIPVNYQWFKNGKPIQGKTASQLVLNHLYPDPKTGENKWNYQCEVFNEVDRAISQIAVVELEESNDRTPFVATQKYAFMVANDDYENLEVLEKPAADIRDLAHLLSSMDFKVFAFRNLTLTEMRNAFISFCKMLMPGCYTLFFFAGHGFELYGQTYLQPVDCSYRLFPDESVCSEYILQGLQERNPALNVLLIDACRKLPSSQGSEHQPGKIFTAHMKNNTIYGYSTSFLCASHESDEENNSVFVKHLKKLITHDRCIEDILINVKSDFSKDPVAKNVQFPTVKSTVTEKRKLNDPILDACTSNQFSDMINWCDVKRKIISQPFPLPQIKAAIIIEFHHHMETFCNGIDVFVFLKVEPNAQIFILCDMEINIAVSTTGLSVEPIEGKALKDVNLVIGNKNLLFKKEILNIQKVNVGEIKGKLLLKFFSRNVTKEIDFNTELIKISQMQLSINHLTSSNVEETPSNKIQAHVKNSFK